MSLPYITYRSILKKKFGTKVLKVPINGGFSCPNKKDGNACTFCDNISFSPAALRVNEVVEQFQNIVKRRKHRYKAFIPYFQPNTNTYAPLDDLKAMYEPLVAIEGVVGLAIGTRPDCLGDDIVKYLGELNSRTYLSLEIGLQSSNNNTLVKISRGHSFEVFADAVNRVAEKGIEVVAHLMIGLPGEGLEDFINSVKELSKLPISGVKIHQLMVIRDTPLEIQYNNNEFKTLTLDEYKPILAELLQYLRPDIAVHRIMADTKDDYGLIAPKWSSQKDSSMMELQRYLEDSGITQGDKYTE